MFPVESPYKTFADEDGKPLDNGYIYIGQPNQNPVTRPVTVYWDAEGKIPAAQPLRTMNGFIVRAGTPANVYINGEYSILVQDKKRRLVFSRTQFKPESPTQTETQAAAEGQTVFTLKQVAYTPGIGSLKVYLDGLRMGQADYFETARDTVTFVRALGKGQEVLFETGSGVNSSSTLDPSLIPYQIPGGGASSVKGGLDGAYAGLSSISAAQQLLYRRRIAYQLPIRFPGYAAVVSNYGFDFLFPQGLTFHGSRLYILYGAMTGTAGSGSFCAVHDRTTGAYISGFVFGTSFGEGIVVKAEGASLFMYARQSSGVLGKYDITALPPNLGLLEPTTTTNNRFYSLLCWDGQQFTMQTFGRADAPSAPRNHFVRLDENLALKSRLELSPLDAWSISADLIDLNPKLQSLSYFRGGYAAGYGATHYYGEATPPSHLCGVKMLADTGEMLSTGLMYPDKFIDVLRGAGQLVDLIENEGVCTVDGKLYALWVTSSHTNTGNYGILITEELGGDLDCSLAAASTAPAFAPQSLQGAIDHDTSGIKNPITGVAFTTLAQVIEFMRDVQLPRYGLFTTNSTITDINGAVFGSGLFVEIVSGNYSTWEVTLHGATSMNQFWVTGPEGALVQTAKPVKHGGSATVGSEEVVLGVTGTGQIATGVGVATTRTHWSIRNTNGVVGLVTTNGTTTTYATSSDERIKDVHGDIAGATDTLRALRAAGGLQMATFKADPNAAPIPMFLAQRLASVAPWAVTVGNGEPGDEPRGEPGDADYDPGFIPWMVDSSHLVPLLCAALLDQADQITFLKDALSK